MSLRNIAKILIIVLVTITTLNGCVFDNIGRNPNPYRLDSYSELKPVQELESNSDKEVKDESVSK